MTDFLTADAILAADDIEYREEEVPEWHGKVRIKALSGKDRDAYEASLLVQRGNRIIRDGRNARAKLVAHALVDATGQRLFTDQQANALGDKALAPLDRLFDVVSEMSKLTEADVEELGKDSEIDLSGSSTSTLPSTSGSEQ